MINPDSTGRKTVIELTQVWAGYDMDTVLEDVSFKMFHGDYVGLIGPNGGGKTTLIRLILGLLKPWRGSVKVMGEPARLGRRFVGYVPQIQLDDRSFPINAWDVVSMGRLQPGLKNMRLVGEDKDVIADALSQTGMLEFARRGMGELSGGQRQRVFISRALASRPEILLLDEPTASVDPHATNQVYELLERLNSHTTILLISHDMDAISNYAKTVGCINRRLLYHHSGDITPEMVFSGNICEAELARLSRDAQINRVSEEDRHA